LTGSSDGSEVVFVIGTASGAWAAESMAETARCVQTAGLGLPVAANAVTDMALIATAASRAGAILQTRGRFSRA
jgi:hypothetical protein